MQNRGIKRLRHGSINLSLVLDIKLNLTVSDTRRDETYRNIMQDRRLKRPRHHQFVVGFRHYSESDGIQYPNSLNQRLRCHKFAAGFIHKTETDGI